VFHGHAFHPLRAVMKYIFIKVRLRSFAVSVSLRRSALSRKKVQARLKKTLT
jgi:hypothetical protein